MNFQCFEMGFGWITFVLVPVIIGILKVDLLHEVIPVCFGQDGCSRDCHIERIPPDDALVPYRRIRSEPVPVDEQQLLERPNERLGRR